LLKVTAAELDAKDGKIFVIADPTKFKTHAEVSAACTENVIGKGMLPSPNKLRKEVLNWPVGTPCNVACGCAAAAEIAVDPETGAVEILKLCDASDVGRVIWRSGCMGQIEGGLDYTIGQALFYEQTFDPATGATLNGSLLHHLHPTTLDIQQDRNEAYAVETLDALGSFGMKGVGEPPVANFYAIAQAIYNATGKWIVESPIYPWKILKSLGKA
jgi:xanthine dehydrogenase molybdenum-binding subunit